MLLSWWDTRFAHGGLLAMISKRHEWQACCFRCTYTPDNTGVHLMSLHQGVGSLVWLH